MRYSCDNCMSSNYARDNDIEAIRCWNCQHEQFIDDSSNFLFAVRSGFNTLEAIENISKSKIVDGEINDIFENG